MYYDQKESGKRIAKLRKKKGLTQEQLAENEQIWTGEAEHRCHECSARPHREADVIALLAEVRRLNRMVDAAVYCLAEVPCGHCVFEEWCSPSPGGPSCEQILRKHLESEAADNG